jgi:hypothetical protein
MYRDAAMIGGRAAEFQVDLSAMATLFAKEWLAASVSVKPDANFERLPQCPCDRTFAHVDRLWSSPRLSTS